MQIRKLNDTKPLGNIPKLQVLCRYLNHYTFFLLQTTGTKA